MAKRKKEPTPEQVDRALKALSILAPLVRRDISVAETSAALGPRDKLAEIINNQSGLKADVEDIMDMLRELGVPNAWERGYDPARGLRRKKPHGA